MKQISKMVTITAIMLASQSAFSANTTDISLSKFTNYVCNKRVEVEKKIIDLAWQAKPAPQQQATKLLNQEINKLAQSKNPLDDILRQAVAKGSADIVQVAYSPKFQLTGIMKAKGVIGTTTSHWDGAGSQTIASFTLAQYKNYFLKTSYDLCQQDLPTSLLKSGIGEAYGINWVK